MSENIEETGFGWIAPNGTTVGCPMFNHLSGIRSWELATDIQEISDAFESLDDVERSCNELADAGEHPEWHMYDMAEMELTPVIIDSLYENGFVRVGVNQRSKEMGVEGIPTAIASLMNKINYVLNEYNAEHQTEYTLSIYRRNK